MVFRAQLDDFGSLYERTYQDLFRTVLGICGEFGLAADVTQDAFESAYRQRATFRGDVPVEAWLHRIAVNAALTSLRRQRVRWAEPMDLFRHDLAGPSFDRSDAIAVLDAVDRLEPTQRAAVVLRYYRDFDYATIASILGTTSNNVGAMLSRALGRLRKDLLVVETGPVGRPSTTGEARHGR